MNFTSFPFQSFYSNVTRISQTVKIKCFQLGIHPLLQCLFPSLMLISDAISSMFESPVVSDTLMD